MPSNTRGIEYVAKFVGGLIIPTGAGTSKIAKSNSEGKLEWGTVNNTGLAENAVETNKIKEKNVTLEKLAAAVQKQIPAEHGRSAEMVAGKITISAPATTATGAIIISPEGTTMTIGAVVVERTAGTGFKVEAAATSTDRINWAVWTE